MTKAVRTKTIQNDSPFCEAHARVDDLIKKLTSPEAMGATLGDIERLLAKDGTEFIRGLLQSYIDARSAAEQPVEVVGADGVARPYVRTSTRTVETPFGGVEVTRKLYRAVGVPAIAPLDAALGLPEEKYTLEVRRIVVEESAKSSFDEVVELIDKRTGASVPKRQVEELTVRSAQDFDEFYAARLREPEATDDPLVLSFDGKGIAMRHDDLRDAFFTFARAPGVEPTSNHAERELRAFVLWRKTKLGSQSDRGDRFAERLMTVEQTCRKQGRHTLESLGETMMPTYVASRHQPSSVQPRERVRAVTLRRRSRSSRCLRPSPKRCAPSGCPQEGTSP